MQEVTELFQNGSEKFAGKLYSKLIEGQTGNLVFSPISIHTCVSLALLGASGETADEIKRALQFDNFTKDQLKEAFEQFLSVLKSGTAFKMATKMAIGQGLSLKPAFSETAIKYFDAIAENMDFSNNLNAAKLINDWIAEKTADKIQNLVTPDSINNLTVMILVNAIYFKGTWVKQFNPSSNRVYPFYLNENDSVEVEFMITRHRFNYCELPELDCSVIELPYEDSNATFLIFLPNNKSGLSQIEANVADININEIVNNLEKHDIRLFLPKFKIEFEKQLNELLKRLGIFRAFTNRAEFNEILDKSGNMQISDVVHKTFIEVNERGTEAAAATKGGMQKMSMPQYIEVNRPFLFVLQLDGHNMFIGRCCKPTMST